MIEPGASTTQSSRSPVRSDLHDVTSELRLDPLRGRWTVLAPGRTARPGHVDPGQAGLTTSATEVGSHRADCPFCPGNEQQAIPEVARTGPGPPGGPGWRVRVVANRYPILCPAPTAGGPAPASGGVHVHVQLPGQGAHEVVILTPDHDGGFARLEEPHAAEALTMLRDRARTHAGTGHRATQVFINHRRAAGASIEHPHAQIVALGVVPPVLEAEVACFVDTCVVCRMIDEDASGAQAPLVVVAGDAVAWCPWASSMAFEVLIAPRRHGRRFEDAEEELAAVADTLRVALDRLERVLGRPAYNVVVHSAPAGPGGDFHWHVHVHPRLRVTGGFEDGTGIPVNDTLPEAAAALLRETGDVRDDDALPPGQASSS